jgi:hypothetical protein
MSGAPKMISLGKNASMLAVVAMNLSFAGDMNLAR